MYRILVAVDGSERADRAAEFAVDLARRLGDGELLVVNVQEPVEESQTHGLGRDAILQHRETLAATAAAGAQAMAERAGVPCAFQWRFGDPARVLTDLASEGGFELIVMGMQGAGAVQTLLLGSVAQRALHLTNVPITLVH